MTTVRLALYLVFLLLSLLIVCLSCSSAAPSAAIYPPDFLWGASTAAYQVEGAWDADGKLPSWWDVLVNRGGFTPHNQTAKVADDHYHRYREDIALMVSLNISAYRFSIAWARLIHENETVNEAGIRHYDAVINALLANGITPLVTLYHWDLPELFATHPQTGKAAGFLNSTFLVPKFAQFARICFERFGDRVKHWATFNEPNSILAGYTGGGAPMRCSDRSRCKEGNDTTETFIAGHTILLAHAAAVAAYRKLGQGGQISIVVSDAYGLPYSDKPEDVAAAERSNVFTFSHWSDPVVFGDYPKEMREALGELLPRFTAAEQAALKGSIDFFALNHYSSRWVYYDANGGPCKCVQTAFNSSGAAIGPLAASDWLYIYPPGLRGAINWVWRRYHLPVMVTENGMDRVGEADMTLAEQLNDVERVDYYRNYIANVGLAISDGVPVKGYFLWSLLDNMEWGSAFTLKFGIVRVDCASGDLSRYVKRSAQFYSGYILQQKEATAAAAAAALVQAGSLSQPSLKSPPLERVVQEIPIVEPQQW